MLLLYVGTSLQVMCLSDLCIVYRAHAVVATDLDMPVPERVASALTAYGPTATITLCGELVLAGTLDLMVGVPVSRAT